MSGPSPEPIVDAVERLRARYREGVLTAGELHARLFELMPAASVEDLLSALDGDERGEFIGWARASFDRDAGPEAFIRVGGESGPDDGGFPERLAMIRAWFSRQVE